MNKIELDILKLVVHGRGKTQRELSEESGFSLGKVNESINLFLKSGLISSGFEPTEKYHRMQEGSRPKNAIILAAGYGMRMVPVNTEIAKGCIEVYGERLIERIISQLQAVGISDITVVVGFMKEKYDYLIDKYGVKLCVNMQYARKNNLVSLAYVKDKIHNTYIVPCDIYCGNNPFDSVELYSWYLVSDDTGKSGSKVRINRRQALVKARKGEPTNSMLGIAYLMGDEARTVKERLKRFEGDERHDNAFWEETLYDGDGWIIYPKLVDSSQCFEINTYEQLRALDETSSSLKSKVINMVAQALNIKPIEICDIRTMKKGMTNRSFICMCQNKRYIVRIPGEGTDKFINREQEHQSYQALSGLGITDKLVYMDPKSGVKITEFMEDSRNCNPQDKGDVNKAIRFLREFHDRDISVGYTFNLFERIEFYEDLWQGKPSIYDDYADTKKKIYELQAYIESQPKKWTLCHIDSVADNFLFVWTGDGADESLRLIDWEYAAMQDAYVDIAMFAIYSMYDPSHIEWLLDAYFDGKCIMAQRMAIYCYIAICGLLWSNWCEYKLQLGVEFGEYSLAQYRYAKDYYRRFRELNEASQ